MALTEVERKERLRLARQRYYQRHREKCLAYGRKYYQENREAMLAYGREYRRIPVTRQNKEAEDGRA